MSIGKNIHEREIKSVMPEGLSFFARSVSPDRAKLKTTLCSLCLCGE